MTRTLRSPLERRVWLACLWIAAACGHEVTIGRYPGDADVQVDAQAGSGGTGGIDGSSGDGGSAGHNECEEIEPVCGTDGMTYMNACLALLAGVFVDHRGACP